MVFYLFFAGGFVAGILIGLLIGNITHEFSET